MLKTGESPVTNGGSAAITFGKKIFFTEPYTVKFDNLQESNSDQFQCLRCGKCCTWGGECRITNREADTIAKYLGISSQEFIDKYTEITADRKGLTLTEKSPGVCIFYTTPPSCAIQDVKPIQCLEFPKKWHTDNWEETCAWGRKNRNNQDES